MTSLCHLVLACAAFIQVVSYISACNEAVCASLVSKCLLLKSCECDMTDKKNCACCKDCHRCLAKLYTECCSCVGMCSDKGRDKSVHKASSVEQLDDPMPELFDVLTEDEDPYLRWTTFTYPAHLDLLYFKPRGMGDDFTFATKVDDGDPVEEEHKIRHGGHHIILDPHSQAMNCTVAYMSQCMSHARCKDSCQSMGAARYRWFHQHGCCECIGSTCLDYGKGEAHCLQCPRKEGEDEEDDEFYDVEIDDTEDEEDLEEGEEDLEEEQNSEGVATLMGVESGGKSVVEMVENENAMVGEGVRKSGGF